jgi:predicted peptidase
LKEKTIKRIETPMADNLSTTEYRLITSPTPAVDAATEQKLKEIDEIPVDVFEAYTFHATGGTSLAYRLLPPTAPAPDTGYPLLVVFHGAGQIGVDNTSHINDFVKLWAHTTLRTHYPAYVLAPQMPERSSVYSGPMEDPARHSNPAPPLHAALELIDHCRSELRVDQKRIYAIGFSMGASTIWNALYLRPGLFAAAVPIAGVPNRDHGSQVARTPLWILHGNQDTANSIEPSRMMFDLLGAIPEARVRFWEFDGLEHALPWQVLAGGEVAAWLFNHPH